VRRLLSYAVAVARLAVVLLLTLLLIPVQWLALRLGLGLADRIPGAYHRMMLALFSVRVTDRGEPSSARPLLIVSNHVSWLDIPVLSSRTPLTFISKAEIRVWPLVGLLARLQRSVFVDRSRRVATRDANEAVAGRLATGLPVVLFCEGTTGDGNRLLPFRSALLGAAREASSAAAADGEAGGGVVQPVTIAYVGRAGLPLGRAGRPLVAWYGDMDLGPHLMTFLRSGPFEAVVIWGEPEPMGPANARKALAVRLEGCVRDALQEAYSGRAPEPARETAHAPETGSSAPTAALGSSQPGPQALHPAA